MLAACYECGESISTDAQQCPRCGYDYTYTDYDEQANTRRAACNAVQETESGPRRMCAVDYLTNLAEYYKRERK
jgi:hypothetical protein